MFAGVLAKCECPTPLEKTDEFEKIRIRVSASG